MRSLSGLSLSGEQLDTAIRLMDAMDAMRADMECCQCPGAKDLFAEWDEFYNYDTGFTSSTILAQVVEYHNRFKAAYDECNCPGKKSRWKKLVLYGIIAIVVYKLIK